MDLKKVFGVLLVAMFMFSLVPMALGQEQSDENESIDGIDDASDPEETEETEEEETEEVETEETEETEEEETEIDEDTKEEVEDFATPHGAYVRLLQLEKSLQKNILAGTHVVDEIDNSSIDANVSNLLDILDEMELLLEDVQEMQENLNGTGEELAEEFVAAKKEAIELSKRFREEARSLVSPGDIGQLRNRVNERAENRLSDVKERVEQARRQHNAKKAAELFERMGVSGADIVEGLRNGEILPEQARERILNRFSELPLEQKREAVGKVKEQVAKKNVHRQAVEAKVRADIAEKLAQRSRERSERLEALSQSAEERSEDLEKRAEEIRERLEKRAEEIKQKIEERRSLMPNNAPTQNSNIGGDGQ